MIETKKMNTEKQNNVGSRQIKVLVTGTGESATKMNIRAGKFKLIIDEPKNMGGSDEGPSPVQVLLMSLAGCLNVTGHEVAKQRGMNLWNLKITIEGEMNPCNFMGCSFDERAGFQNINVNVKADFEDSTEEEIKSWLLETESRCPVTDNIKTGTTINII